MATNASKVSLRPPAFPDRTVVFTVDVEDYFMSPECVRFEDWGGYESAIHIGMERCLALFNEYQAQGTFFFVGWLAEKFPEIVRWTKEQGHEIATHTFTHKYVSEMDAHEFEETLKRSLDAIQNAAQGCDIIGHRAPAFSLERSKPWQFDLLEKYHIRYDSSINPFQTYLFGDKAAPRFPYRIGDIVEIPPAAISLFGRRFPVGGGGALRILPNAYLRFARRRRQNEGHPPVIHMHPWEYAPDHPPIKLPLKLRMIHYAGLNGVERKVRSIFQDNQCATMREYYERLTLGNE